MITFDKNNKTNKSSRTLAPLLIQIAAWSAFVSISNAAYAMQKCQDESGQWHYGDFAVTACENSKVTTLNSRGFIEDEVAAPKTEEELAAEAKTLADAQVEAERLRKIEENKQRILSIYETEADIDRHRDNQLDSVNGNIAVHKAFLKSQEARIKRNENKAAATTHPAAKKRLAEDIVTVKERMQTYQSALEKLLVQKEEIVERFSREKALYQRLKNESS